MDICLIASLPVFRRGGETIALLHYKNTRTPLVSWHVTATNFGEDNDRLLK